MSNLNRPAAGVSQREYVLGQELRATILNGRLFHGTASWPATAGERYAQLVPWRRRQTRVSSLQSRLARAQDDGGGDLLHRTWPLVQPHLTQLLISRAAGLRLGVGRVQMRSHWPWAVAWRGVVPRWPEP